MRGLRGGAILLWISAAAYAQTDEPRHSPAFAPEAAALSSVVWYCWYGAEPEHATCFRPASLVPDAGGGSTVEMAIRTMAGLLVQSGKHLAAARVFRRFPAAFDGATQLIPLHTIPFDLESVAALSQSVMCARSRAPCVVAFDLRWSEQETSPPQLNFGRAEVAR